MKTKIVLPFIIASFVSACSTTNGSAPVISSHGPLVSDTGAAHFLAQEIASRNAQKDREKALSFLDAGLDLVDMNCNTFFMDAGKTQQWLIIARETVGAVGTLATGIVALHTGGRAATNLALATGAGFSGLDIYTRNFLFSAENISSVHDLANNALRAHRTAVRNAAASSISSSYGEAALAIMDHQDLCSPMRLTALVRDAIKRGQIQISQTTDNSALSSDIVDDTYLRLLGDILNASTPVSAQQAGGLWWLLVYNVTATDEERKQFILPSLEGISNSPLNADGSIKTEKDWPFSVSVKRLLNSLNASTKASFNLAITKKRAEILAEKADVPASAASEDNKDKDKVKDTKNTPATTGDNKSGGTSNPAVATREVIRPLDKLNRQPAATDSNTGKSKDTKPIQFQLGEKAGTQNSLRFSVGIK